MASQFFRADSNFGIKIQKILSNFKDGLTPDHIIRELRKTGTHVYDVNSIMPILDDRKYFVKLSGNMYCLKSLINAFSDVQKIEEPFIQEHINEGDIPLIINLPQCLSDYIVFDLETTGFDPEKNSIIQIAALKVIHNEPSDFLDLYVNPYPDVLSSEIKNILSLTADIEEQIYGSPPVKIQYDIFRRFCGDLPLIAHNGRFDFSFLKAVEPNINNILFDTMELALLTLPGIESYKLEALVKYFNIEDSEIMSLADRFSINGFSGASFHDARVDVLYLYIVYGRLLNEFLSGNSGRVWSRFFKDINFIIPQIDNQGDIIKIHSAETLTEEQTLLDSSEQTCFDLLDKYLHEKSYQKREGQVEMMKLVFKSINDGLVKMIEAPTGTGKTIAYIIPSVIFSMAEGKKIAISTAVKNLQDQLMEDLAEFSLASGLNVKYQLLKGRSSYICMRKLRNYVSIVLEGQASLQELICLTYIISLVHNTTEGTLDELNYWMESRFPVLKELKKEFTSEASSCAGKDCNCHHECFRKRAYDRAALSHIIIINHSLWLSEPEDLPKFETLILDEAHNLEDAATSAFTEEVSTDTWNIFFETIINPKTGRGFAPRLMALSKDGELQRTVGALFSVCKISRELVRDLGNHFRDFIKSCSYVIDEKYGASLRLEREPEKIEPLKWKQVDGVRKQFNFYLKEMQNILEKLKSLISSSAVPHKDEFLLNLASVTVMFLENYTLFNDILKVNNIKKIYWLEVEEREHSAPFWALKCAPLDVSEILMEKYSRLSSIILTSATLSIKGGDFSFFSSRLGLDERLGVNNTHIIKGDIDYSRAFLALTSYLNYIPSPSTMERFKEEMSEELKRFLSFTDGRALVLFNSRERMEYSYNLCSPCLEKAGISVYCQKNGMSKKAIQTEFSLNKSSVLMGLKSFWEGIDVPGESLSFVIMEKLPFPFVFDPLYRARREAFASNPSIGHEFEDYIFPLMAIRFKQGFGRLLRREDDRGAVLLLDRRIHKKSYKYELLASLPGYTRDDEAENDRKSLYLKIADFLPGLIDLNSKHDFLDNLPDDILINIQKKLNELELPRIMSQEEYNENIHKIKRALKDIFGYDDFRSPEQEEIVKSILTGRDVTGILSTGSGKSLCFQLPALLRKGTTIVFSPLIALMKDQFESLREKGIELIDCIYSGQKSEEREEIFRRMKEGKSRLVYISPERLRDGQLLEAIKHTDIINVIVDEAHCIDMWGTGFRPDYLYIAEIFRKTGMKPPVAAFTATATEETKRNIARNLEMENPVTVQGTFNRPELNFIVYNNRSLYNRIKHRHDKFNVLMKILRTADFNRESVLIYVSATVEADQLARRLRMTGFDIRSYHGRMNSRERDSVQEMFMDGHINMVVCTKAFGMGIDKKDIRYVIHYNVPGDIESYFQETGRAGRDGKESYCILLYHYSDLRIQRFFNNSVMPDEELINNLFLYIKNTGDETVYLNPGHIVTSLDIEESELKVALHILEVQGFIVRDMDFTVQASLMLLHSSENILNFLREQHSDDFTVINECFSVLTPPHYRKINVTLPDLSISINRDVFSIEQAFIRLALEEKIVFRPWEKGITVRLTQNGKDEPFTYSDNGENIIYEKRLARKLDTMIDYASKNKICRRKHVLEYFGEDYREQNCGKCDVCAPEQSLPWREMTGRDIPEIYDFFDPGFTILELLKWNSELRGKPMRNPYGKKTLVYILTGNMYMLLFKEEDEKKKSWKSRVFRQCPYFAILDRVPGREKTLEGIFDRLYKEDYIEYEDIEFGGNGNKHKYSFPVPAVKGYERLEGGELLGW